MIAYIIQQILWLCFIIAHAIVDYVHINIRRLPVNHPDKKRFYIRSAVAIIVSIPLIVYMILHWVDFWTFIIIALWNATQLIMTFLVLFSITLNKLRRKKWNHQNPRAWGSSLPWYIRFLLIAMSAFICIYSISQIHSFTWHL